MYATAHYNQDTAQSTFPSHGTPAEPGSYSTPYPELHAYPTADQLYYLQQGGQVTQTAFNHQSYSSNQGTNVAEHLGEGLGYCSSTFGSEVQHQNGSWSLRQDLPRSSASSYSYDMPSSASEQTSPTSEHAFGVPEPPHFSWYDQLLADQDAEKLPVVSAEANSTFAIPQTMNTQVEDPYGNYSFQAIPATLEDEFMHIYQDYIHPSYTHSPEYQYYYGMTPEEYAFYNSAENLQESNPLISQQLQEQHRSSLEKEKSQYETVEEVARAVIQTPLNLCLSATNSEEFEKTAIYKEPSPDTNFKFCVEVMKKIRGRRSVTSDGMEISRCNLCQSFSVALTPRGISEFMKLHLFNHAKTNPFSCKICGKCETTNPSKVRAHIRKRHPQFVSCIPENLVDRRPELDVKLCELAKDCYGAPGQEA